MSLIPPPSMPEPMQKITEPEAYEITEGTAAFSNLADLYNEIVAEQGELQKPSTPDHSLSATAPKIAPEDLMPDIPSEKRLVPNGEPGPGNVEEDL